MKTLLLGLLVVRVCIGAYAVDKTVTLGNSTMIPATQTNFTVLVCANGSAPCDAVVPELKQTGSGGSVTSANGYDINFSSTACSSPTLMKWEMQYSSASGATYGWVLVPSMSAGGTFHLCIGDASIVTFQGGATGDAWDTSILGRYHFGDGTTLSLLDSTVNALNLTNNGSVTATSGKINGAANLVSSSSQYLSSTSTYTQPTAITLNAYVYVSAFTYPYNIVVASQGATTDYAQIFVKSNGKIAMYFWCSSGSVFYDGTGSNTLVAGNWYLISVSYDSVNGLVGYVNGSVDGTAAAAGTLSSSEANTLIIGQDPLHSPRFFDGKVDEVSFLNTNTTADWNTSRYYNYSDPANFAAISGSSPPSSALTGRILN